MSRWRCRIVLLVAAALAAGGCTRSEPDPVAAPKEVRIALLAPLSGPNKTVGEDAQRGAQFAVDVINGANTSVPLPLAARTGLPNYGNTRLRLVVSDIGGAVSPAAATTRVVTDQGAVAVVGATDPDATLEASLRAERLPVPFVNGDSSLSFLTERGLDWFFHTGPSVRDAGEAYFSLLQKQQSLQRQAKRIAVLHPNNKAGNDVSTVVNELAQEGGFEVVKDVSYDPAQGTNTLGLRGLISQVQAVHPDVVFVAPSPGDVAAMADAFNQLNYRPAALMSFGSGLGDAILKANGPSTGGMCRETAWSRELADRNPAARAVSKQYEDKFSAPMTEEAASTFTAIYTLALAINDAKSTDARRIRSALLSLNVPGQDTIMPWDGIRFDETHQNVGSASVIEQFVNRSNHPVFPFDAVPNPNDDLVWPASQAP